MLTHRQIWNAIDALAGRHGLSVSGLAKKAGLDPTTFNRSKRETAEGRERWPGTESIAKILEATGASLYEFTALMHAEGDKPFEPISTLPLIRFEQAGNLGYFDDGGFPVHSEWDEILFPEIGDDDAYALEVTGTDMLPLYREGDMLVVSPTAGLRRGDRVVVRTGKGDVQVRTLTRRTAKTVELSSINPEYRSFVLPVQDIDWMARIIWASQ